MAGQIATPRCDSSRRFPCFSCHKFHQQQNFLNRITVSGTMGEVVTIDNFAVKLPPVQENDPPLYGLVDMGRYHCSPSTLRVVHGLIVLVMVSASQSQIFLLQTVDSYTASIKNELASPFTMRCTNQPPILSLFTSRWTPLKTLPMSSNDFEAYAIAMAFKKRTYSFSRPKQCVLRRTRT